MRGDPRREWTSRTHLADYTQSSEETESIQPGEAAANSDSLRVAFSATALVGLLGAVGITLHRFVVQSGLDRAFGTNVYYRLYASFELPHLILLELFAAYTAVILVLRARRRQLGQSMGEANLRCASTAEEVVRSPRRLAVWLVALAVMVIGVAVGEFVMHRLMLSMDEFSADFQARIFAHGQYAPVVPWPWRSLQDAIVPIFVEFHGDSGRWVSAYLPVYALLKAPFVRVGAQMLLNPLLSAGSIAAIAAVSRRLWPDEALRPWTAIALLATSSELLITSGSGYSMPAHLFLNLIWLWLYLRGDARSWGWALVVGVLALGLHQPVPHALFVAPFMLRLVRERRWSRISVAAVAYAAGLSLWFAWMRFANPATSDANAGLLSLFEWPTAASAVLLGMNVSLLLTWQAPLLGMLVLVALAHPRRMEPVSMDLALGVLLTLTFFVFYPSTQGHGWGYRYAFQVLGNLCLLAAAGVPAMREVLGLRDTRRWLAAGLALTLAIQLPLRLRDTEHFVRPFAAANAYLQSRPETVLLVRGDSLWYGRDLIRNDPFLRRPIIARGDRLAPSFVQQLEHALPGRVRAISSTELRALGMLPTSRPPGMVSGQPRTAP